MTIKVAINGYGRIGRNVLRAHYEGGRKHDLAIVAINDLGSPETNAHLTRYDTVHRKFPGKIDVDGDAMVVNGDRIRVLAQKNPAELPWAALGVDVVLESTGLFTTKEKASAHLKAGAKKVPRIPLSRTRRARPTASRRWSSRCTTRSAWSMA
jgi:glyceraldehyde 3-phosphate dehydrogenase